jgi:lysophospholipase L1-like esterase
MTLRASNEKATAYSVRIDDRPPILVQVSRERERYELASGLDPAAIHDAVITREVEAFAGAHELLDVEAAKGAQLLPPRARNFRIEIVGDSISCGYGVLGANERCGFSYETERASSAYGARLGRAFDADVTNLCWSGRGVLRNYDGSTTGTMPDLFELAIPVPPEARWSFSDAPQPDVVITNLGTNDFLGGAGRPLDRNAFEDAYVKFLKRVRDVYPDAWIFVTTSAMMREVPPAFGRVVARRTSEGDARIELVTLPSEAPHWGCDSHPDVEMNVRIAAALEARIRARLHR